MHPEIPDEFQPAKASAPLGSVSHLTPGRIGGMKAPPRMNRVHLKTYGCQMNERDSEAVAAMLRARGYRIVAREEDCDILLLNTCSVRDAAEQKAIGKAGYALARKRHQPDFVLGILGCMAQNRGAELLDRLPDVDLIVGTQKFHRVPDYLDNLAAARAAGAPVGATIVDTAEEVGSQNTIRDHLLGGVDSPGAVGAAPALAAPGEVRGRGEADAVDSPVAPQVTAFVSIQQGCNMHCSFCIVPKTRGDERSRPMDEIVAECAELVARGVREITLLGQIVTSYGRREWTHAAGRSPFVQLLDRVHAIEGLQRIRFTSPHPLGFRPDLAEAYARLPKLCEYVHLPLQSGSDRILRAMNRPYTRARYLEIVAALRAAQPGMYFSTDVIVGFPGETEEDFAATRALFEAVNYDMAYIFKYSVRSGTPAAAMGAQVPEEVKEERNRILLGLLEANSVRRNRALEGTVEEVLVEGPDRTGARFTGRTRGNRVAVFAAAPRLIGSLVPLRVTRTSVSTLYGDLVVA
jgi:tRNA-2-methylthio-N6-dimethylallyladenosine synthase